jgi:myo-inositol-1(or 4)-monophosphatase
LRQATTIPSAPDLVDIAADAALAVAPRIRTGFGCGRRGAIDTKTGPQDVLTVFDLEAEDAIAAHLLNALPSSCVLGEERGVRGRGSRVRWIVDPIDGTSNFAAGIPLFATSIGVSVDDQIVGGCVVAPMSDEVFAGADDHATLNGRPIELEGEIATSDALVLVGPATARLPGASMSAVESALTSTTRGVRHLGTSALALAWVAAGRADAMIDAGFSAWDVAGGIGVLRAAGGHYEALREDADERPDWQVGAQLATSARFRHGTGALLASIEAAADPVGDELG